MSTSTSGAETNITGLRIRELRRQAGLTQEELGKKLNVTKATINKYENGIVGNLPRTKVQTLADVFEVSPAYLMGWSDDTSGKNLSFEGLRRPALNTATAAVEATSDSERALLKIYRQLPQADQNKVMAQVYAMVGGEPITVTIPVESATGHTGLKYLRSTKVRHGSKYKFNKRSTSNARIARIRKLGSGEK